MFNIKCDSRKVKKGDTFVALNGYNVDGHDYILDAIKNGATKIIAEHGSYDVETILTNDTKDYITDYLSKEYKKDLEKIKFIGITGTNGKTSTSYIIYQILNELGIKTAYIGTIGFYLENKVEEISNTTPNIIELYDLIFKAINKNVTHIVMEVSSHALDLNRIEGINFDICGFTNLTQDHLDYHKTMGKYLEAKKKILDKTSKIIVNIDDEYGKYFCIKNFKSIGFSNSNFLINSYENSNNKTLLKFKYNEKNYEVITNLIGKFNVYNFMIALAVCSNYESIENIISITNKVIAPPGRCDLIVKNNKKVIVDYAHTPDAVNKIINTFKEKEYNNIITVIGCGGNRDTLKRPLMGYIVTENSDYVVFTNDNPREEEENNIMKDILSGVKKSNYEIILNRSDAIKSAIDIASKNDIVLILGKGHEDYQIIGKKKYHLSDKEEILKYIN